MKRTISFILAAVLLFALVPVQVNAENDTFRVYAERTSAAAGTNEVYVDIGIDNNPGINGFSFCVDADDLIYLEAECLIDGYTVVSDGTEYDVNIAWTDSQLFTGNGSIARVKYAVPADAEASNADINIIYRDGYDSFYRSENNREIDIPVITENGYINVTENVEPQDFFVSVGYADAEDNGSGFVIPICVNNNPGFSGFSLCVDYDTNRLELTSSEIVLDGDYKVINMPDGHNAGFAWTGSNSFTDDGNIVLLNFNVIPGVKEGKSFISISLMDGYDSFYKTQNNTEIDVPLVVQNGYVDVHSEHYFTGWETVTEATCTHAGLSHYSCQNINCTYSENQVVSQLPHTYGDWIKDTGFDENGVLVSTCSECGIAKTKTVTDIAVTTQPTKLTYLEAKDSLDLSNGKLTVEYSDSSSDVIDLSEAEVNGFDNTVPGIQTLSVSYGGKTSSLSITIQARALQSIAVTALPSKITYLEAKDTLDLTGGKLTLYYDNGTNSLVDLSDGNVTVIGFDNTVIGPQTLTVSYGGITTSFDVSIQAKSLAGVSVTSLPAKTTYLEGKDTLDVTGGKLTLTYDNDTSSVIDLSDDSVTVTGFDNTLVGNQNITVACGGKTTSFNVTIQAKSLTSIAVTTLPTRTIYLEYKDNLDLSGGKLSLYYDNDTVSVINLDSNDVNVSGFDNSIVGSQTLTVTYGGKSTSFDVTIIDKTLTSISITSLPAKTTYLEAKELLDLTGGQLTLFYDNENTQTISLTNAAVIVSGFDNSIIGLQTLTVSYEGKTTSFNITIQAKSVTSIAVTTLPTKLEYLEGKDQLDLSGGKITLYYDNDTYDVLDLNTAEYLAGFNNTIPGEQRVFVTSGGSITSFVVMIIAKSLTSIAVTTPPTKITYLAGQAFDPSGMIITAYYDNDTSMIIESSDYEYSPVGPLNPGNASINISYNGKTAEQTVTVLRPYVIDVAGDKCSITVNTDITKINLIISYYSSSGKMTSGSIRSITVEKGIPITYSLNKGRCMIFVMDEDCHPLTEKWSGVIQ